MSRLISLTKAVTHSASLSLSRLIGLTRLVSHIGAAVTVSRDVIVGLIQKSFAVAHSAAVTGARAATFVSLAAVSHTGSLAFSWLLQQANKAAAHIASLALTRTIMRTHSITSTHGASSVRAALSAISASVSHIATLAGSRIFVPFVAVMSRFARNAVAWVGRLIN